MNANSRNRLGESEFFDLEFALPTIDEQHRIVRGVQRVTIAIARNSAACTAAGDLLTTLRRVLIDDLEDDSVALGMVIKEIDTREKP